MNPQDHDNNLSFELPPPVQREGQESVPSDVRYGVKGNEQPQNIALERGTSGPVAPQQPVQSTASGPIPQAPPIVQPVTANDDSTSSTAPATPHIADDTDLIEKEWVDKAKEIVAKTADDPHLQNIEMNRFKADYLKKRYNKDLKLSKDA